MADQERDGKEAYWRAVLERRGRSGLTLKAFCRQEKIRESAFYYWRRAIRERDEGGMSASKAPAFVPAVVTGTSDHDTSIAIELPSGPVLRLPITISASWMAELIAALDAGGKR